MREIIFKIGKDGQTTIEVNGACGEECKDLTKPFEERLGVVEDTELKPEFYEEQEKDYQYLEE